MSALEEKLESRRPSTGGAARATRKQLLARRGAREADAKTITVDTMGGREVWRHVGGDAFEQEVRS